MGKIQLGLGMCYKENIPKTDKRQLYLLESSQLQQSERQGTAWSGRQSVTAILFILK